MNIMSECRLCLKIKPPVYIYNESKSLPKKIWDCCGLMVTQNDGLPDQICFPCELKLNSFSEFRQMCIKNCFLLNEQHRRSVSYSPDIYQDVVERNTTEDIESFTTQFDCLSKDTCNDPMPNILLSQCRFCLQNGFPMYIFDKSKSLPEKILDSCGLMVVQNDGLPDKICFLCETKLNYLADFKQTCMKNYSILEKRYSEIKYEILDLKDCIDEKYSIEDIKITQESETAWNDYLSRSSTNEPNITNSSIECSDEKKKTIIGNEEGSRPLHSSDEHTKEYQITKLKMFKCDKCNYKTTTRNFFIQHNNICNKNKDSLKKRRLEKKHQCDKCGYRTAQTTQLFRHIETMHSIKTVECDICHTTLRSEFSLKVHLKRHTNLEKPHQCDKCDYKTNKKINLIEHINAIHLNKTYECDICPKNFKTAYSLKKHVKRHSNVEKKHQCTKCDYKTELKARLIRHVKAVHSDKTFECNICQVNLKSEYLLEKHVNRHMKDKIRHGCDKCDFKSKYKQNLINHIKKVHSDKTFQCNICQVNVKSEYFLEKHVNRHMKDKIMHGCDKCDFKSKYKQNIINHIINRHSAIKAVECDVCHKSLKNKDSLKIHVKQQHMNAEKKHQCDKCDYKTRTKCSLNRHIENIHLNNKILECDVCYRKFKSINYLNAHSKVHMRYLNNNNESLSEHVTGHMDVEKNIYIMNAII